MGVLTMRALLFGVYFKAPNFRKLVILEMILKVYTQCLYTCIFTGTIDRSIVDSPRGSPLRQSLLRVPKGL